MAVNHAHAVSVADGGALDPAADDRCCPNCRQIALAFDPTAGGPRCRSCDELAATTS